MKINYEIYQFFKVLFIVLMLKNSPIANSQSEWCWTKSMVNDPTYIFDPKKGGVNWGFCEKPNNKPTTVDYDISIETSKLANSDTE